MLSKYAHLKGTALSNSLIYMYFQPLKILSVPLTSYPPTKFLNPLTEKFFALRANHFVLDQYETSTNIRGKDTYHIINITEWQILLP